MKKKDLKTIEVLRSNASKARDAGNFQRASDLLLEMAQFFRSVGEKEAAMKEFQNVANLARKAHVRADEILALRGIAEIRSENGEQEECLEFLNKYERLVMTNPTEYQLMLTVGSYCFIKMFTVDERNENLLQQAKRYAEKSMGLLETEEMDLSVMLQGDGVSIRKAAFDIADLKNKFEIMRSRIDFPWRDKVTTAMELCKLADSSMKMKRLEANLFLAQAFFENRDIEKGVQTLLDIYEASVSRASGIPDDDREKYSELLIFAYRASIRIRQLESEKDRAGQYLKNDKLADLYNNAGFKQAALHHYNAAVKLADSDEPRRAALVSCAETAADLKKYKEAAGFFERVLTIEDELEIDTSETCASLFAMRLFSGYFDTDADVNLRIDELEKHIMKKNFLIAVYNAAAKFYEIKGNKSEEIRFRTLEDNFMKEFPNVDCDEDAHDNRDNNDSLDELGDEDILEIMRGKANEKAKKKALAKAGRKENQYGETKLIERAREGKLDDVKILISQGADVNKADPVGWTPLSEAVGANNIDIVKYLLIKGANPNSQSKDGWIDTYFGGKITPLMEACTNGFHEIAAWLLQHTSANSLVTATNLDGWSSADFMSEYIKRARRGTESEADFQRHLNDCKNVLEKIRKLQRKQGFPVRSGDPPDPRPKSDDTPKFAAEKEKAHRRARINEKKKGAADDYQDAISGIGSKSRQAEKENGRKEKTIEDDMFDENDDDDNYVPLARPLSNSSIRKSRVYRLSSDSEEENNDAKQKMNEKKRTRKSLDFYDDPNFGLDNDGRPPPSQSTNLPKRVSGIQLMLQKKGKGSKRSMEVGDENGVSIVPDEFDIDERSLPKRRRNESESSQSESNVSASNGERRDSLGSVKGLFETGVPSPCGTYSTESRTSLSSASALLATTNVRVVIEIPGVEPDKTVLSKAPSDTDISDLPKHIEGVRNAINGASCEWLFGGDVIESMTLSDLAELTEQKYVEIRCRVKNTLEQTFQKRCDSSDVNIPLSAALKTLESSRSPSLVLNDGAKYKETTRDALWRTIESHSMEKTNKDAQWRVEKVQIENFHVPSFAIRALIKMRPRDALSLRYCAVDDSKLEDIIEVLDSDAFTLKWLDLSFNDFINPGFQIATMTNKLRVNTLFLQGLSGVLDGRDLMKALGGVSLNYLALDENPWLDDLCMQELVKGNAIGNLTTLRISKCAIRTMNWMEGHSFKSLKYLSLAENNGIAASGWDRVAEFIRSSATALHTLDISGTAARSVILDALISRSSQALLTLTLSRCNGITPSEICRVLGPLVHGERSSINFKLSLEKIKVEEVHATEPLLAVKALKINLK